MVYVHDPDALTVGGWPETLEAVVGDTVAPLIAVFVDAPRMRGFETVFAEQVVPEVDGRYRTRAERAGRANVAMGWAGNGAATLTFAHAELFGGLGIQSLFGMERQLQELEEALDGVDPAATPVRIYYEWGRWDLISPHEEMDMRASGRRGWELLRERGFEPLGGEVWDSTDWASWRNRTGLLLQALFPARGDAAPADLARWVTGE